MGEKRGLDRPKTVASVAAALGILAASWALTLGPIPLTSLFGPRTPDPAPAAPSVAPPATPPTPATPVVLEWRDLSDQQRHTIARAVGGIERLLEAGRIEATQAAFGRAKAAHVGSADGADDSVAATCFWAVVARPYDPTSEDDRASVVLYVVRAVEASPSTRVWIQDHEIRPSIDWEYRGRPGTLDPSRVRPVLTPRSIHAALVVACVAAPTAP